MMKLRFPFPYTPRKYQAEIMHSIYEAFEKKGHLVLESGTGTGKTVVALAPAVEYACRNGKKVLYLTRTNSQQRQVIHELRAILNEVKKSQRNQNGKNENIFGLGLQGRQNMCPFAKKDTEYKNCTAEELARMCKFRKEETEVLIEKGITKFPEETKACPYY
ncbi:MAG: DEAD/DEAH box helicase family protein, partial [Thermoplasmata archaeon]